MTTALLTQVTLNQQVTSHRCAHATKNNVFSMSRDQTGSVCAAWAPSTDVGDGGTSSLPPPQEECGGIC